MATVAISIEGFSQLRRKLREFPLKVSRKADRDALRAGAEVFKAAAKREAPESDERFGEKTGKRLVLRIGFKSLRRKPGEVGFYVIRSRAPHSNLVQLGTKNRRNKRGQFRGSTIGDPYMERAFRKSSGAATAAIAARMKTIVEAAVRGV